MPAQIGNDFLQDFPGMVAQYMRRWRWRSWKKRPGKNIPFNKDFFEMNGDEVREFHETFGSPIKDGLVEFPEFGLPGKPRKSRILSICLLPTALRCLLMSWKGQ